MAHIKSLFGCVCRLAHYGCNNILFKFKGDNFSVSVCKNNYYSVLNRVDKLNLDKTRDQLPHFESEVINTGSGFNDSPEKNHDIISSEDIDVLIKKPETGILETCHEDVSDISMFSLPSFNLAAYINNSYTLQQFLKMGVDLYKLENRKGAAECILKLDFDKHVKMHLRFLHDIGVPAEEFGVFVTRNPFIFEQTLEDLSVRINYLEAKKFEKEAISYIITKNPNWLNFSTIEIDKRLGFFQHNFILSGDEVRDLARLRPRIITYELRKVAASLFAVKEDMGFNEEEAKFLLLKKPKIFDIQRGALISRFDYVHNIMGISHEQITQHPTVLLFRGHITKQRHEFLRELGKAQYNPKLPGYVPLTNLVFGSDVDFCKNIAKTSIDVFNTFLKTC